MSDPIEYLIVRKFPVYRALQVPPSLSNMNDGIPGDERQRLLREIEAYRATLKAKAPEELRALVEQEQAKEAQMWSEKARRDEQERFFNKPHAKADFSHWSKAVYWTLDEALALAFGKSPDAVSWEKVQPYVNVSPFAREYARVRDLAMRAKNWKQLSDPVAPSSFFAWARRTGVAVPDELVKATEARGIVIADWQDNYQELKAQFDVLLEDRDKLAVICRRLIDERDTLKKHVVELEQQPPAKLSSEGLNPKGRNTLYRLIVALCVAAKIKYLERGAAKVIEALTQQVGLPVGDDTIRKILDELPEVDSG